MTIFPLVTGGLLGYGLVVEGLAVFAVAPVPPLVINRDLHSVTIMSTPNPTPWTIDPERTQQL